MDGGCYENDSTEAEYPRVFKLNLEIERLVFLFEPGDVLKCTSVFNIMTIKTAQYVSETLGTDINLFSEGRKERE